MKTNKTLQDALDSGKSYNLNLIKFIAAISVIFSHSFGVCYGGIDLLSDYTAKSGMSITIGGVAVAIFLFVSGLFVSKSLDKCHSGKVYFGSRFFRIFPLLIVILLISVFIMGPLVTNVSLWEYFTSVQTYQYLLYIFMIPVYSITGVFTSNPSSLVNGALWTLILEVICYVCLYIAYRLHFFRKKNALLILCGIIVVSFILSFDLIPFISALNGYIRPFLLFFIGMIFYVFRDRIVLNYWGGCLSILIIVVSFICGYGNIGLLIGLPYVICWISYTNCQCSERLARLGNYSYGIYLVGYPIQQILRLNFVDITPVMNTLLAAVLAFLFAVLLNRLIEEPSIHYFNKKWRKQI
ncbi:MAG: acyltransferase [Erysipelotrichaceae bacterium]|nr:acyltransferase [Erysipelotrichaceae bacterium]